MCQAWLWEKTKVATAAEDGLKLSLRSQVLNAAEFGVPQQRRRLFMSALKLMFTHRTSQHRWRFAGVAVGKSPTL